MAKLLLPILLLLCAVHCRATMIAVGYHSRYAKIWRFYERNDQGGFSPKVLIYNLTDTPITFLMKVVLSQIRGSDGLDERSRAILYRLTGLTSDTVIRPVAIPANSYGIYALEQVADNRTSGFYDAVIINGTGAGIEDEMTRLSLPNPEYRYYSREGTGGSAACLIGTNDLLVSVGHEGHFTCYFSNFRDRRDRVREWRFEVALLQGAGAVSIADPGGTTFSISPDNPKTSFPVDITHLDSFSLEINFEVYDYDPFPEIDLSRSWGGGRNGMDLPILLNRP